ncbi:hypothetical protein G6F64_014307 [Rhizopus arrhizus]|uniref:Uncharacterized protein n=1 Tax=Rhizopus oryzae TaxID=64495 RepID=A0A9P6WTP5_RHIOR|nr:hypothetical protein G6F64_014307 [Rhizopus arrhizus]
MVPPIAGIVAGAIARSRVAAGPWRVRRAPVVVGMVDERLGRAALVVIVELRAVVARIAYEPALHVGGRRVAVVAGGQFARVGVAADAIRPAVVAHASVVDVVDDDGVGVDIGDARHVHVRHGPVVPKP